jgi:hypothetical protein
MVAHFAIQKLGAIVLPLFTLFGADALAFRLADAGASAAITDAAHLPRLAALRADLPALRTILSLGGGPGALDLESAIAAHPPLPAPHPAGPEDPAVMIYTSGTTGPPKGALHAHRFLLGHLPSMEITHDGFPRPGDCGWTPADWAWIGGLMDMAMPCLYYGVPLVARRMAKFDPAEAFRPDPRPGRAQRLPAAHGAETDARRRPLPGCRLAQRLLGRRGAGRRPAGLGPRRRSAARSTSSMARPNATLWSPRPPGSWR